MTAAKDTDIRSGDADLQALTDNIARSRHLVARTAICVFGAFFVLLALSSEFPAPDKFARLGTFGDFMGGILNPLIAFAAFYWITVSVRYQKQELSETRDTLDKTKDANREQAEHSYSSVRLNVLTGLIAAATAEVQTLQTEAIYIAEQLLSASGNRGAYLLRSGTSTNEEHAKGRLYEIAERISRRLDEVTGWEIEIRNVLKVYPDHYSYHPWPERKAAYLDRTIAPP